MSDQLSRRAFLASSGALGLTATLGARSASANQQAPAGAAVGAGDDHRGPAAVSSGNGLRTVERALGRIRDGADPVLAVVQGVAIVEEDPDDLTVGIGGLPNEEGVITLDASVMHGPTHKAGAVAALEDTVNAAGVALKVLQTTDHVMIVGEGAKRFARAHGFPHQDLMTDRTREIWLRWKRNNGRDDWLNDDEMEWDPSGERLKEDALGAAESEPIPYTTGTIHCGATDAAGNVSACTTTSGLSWKIPGRVGDSPIIGAGMYVDNEIGSAGATGRGESVIQSCGSFSVVQHMGRGLSPTEACLAVMKEIADRSVKQRRLRDEQGRPNFNVVLYAMRKDGAYGSACMRGNRTFTAADSTGARTLRCAPLYED